MRTTVLTAIIVIIVLIDLFCIDVFVHAIGGLL